MRLINNETLVMEEFMGSGSEVPRYAILSHTWEGGEVTFQDFTHPDKTLRQQKNGYAKILKTCELAKAAGIKYSWVDTCCIDKTSSAELTEAINSMFQWYKESVVCYAWLADLPNKGSSKESLALAESPLKHCRWFTRGWTLQELIAPQRVEFFDQDWNFCGTKTDLCEPIIAITKINSEVLHNPDCLSGLSIAQRMSWASTRQTTRIEDMAYCLLGIFDVNMPMLYGEGKRAFLRLQEEIAKNTNDLSLLAWKTQPTKQTYHGIFAVHPVDFRNSGSIKLISDTVFNPEFSITNKGLKIQTDISTGSSGHYYMHLQCADVTDAGSQRVGIRIVPRGGGVYARVRADEFAPVDQGTGSKSTLAYLFKTLTEDRALSLEDSHGSGFTFRKGLNQAGDISSPEFPFQISQVQPIDAWDSQRRTFITQGAHEFTGFILFRVCTASSVAGQVKSTEMIMLVCGITQGEDEPWVTLATVYDGAELFQYIRDLGDKRMAGAAPKRKHIKGVLVRNNSRGVSHQVSVAIEKVVSNRQNMYCIDLKYEEAQSENYREDKPGTLSRIWTKKD